MQRVNRHEHHIVILINQLDNLLSGISVGDTNQARELTYSVIDMHHVIARLKLIQLFERKSHFATACLVATQIVFMKAVEYLMVGKDAVLQRMIYETLVQSTVYRSKFNLVSPLLEYIPQAVGLLHAIRADKDFISTLQEIGKRTRYQIEILMEDGLHRSLELKSSLRSAYRLVAELYASELQSLCREIGTVNQHFLQTIQVGSLAFVCL